MDAIKKWLSDLKSEMPIFAQLCKSVGQLLKKLICKEETELETAKVIALQKQTVKTQIVVCTITVAVLFIVFRGCGSSSLHESKPHVASASYDNSTPSASNRNADSVSHGESEAKVEQTLKMPQTAQEAFTRKVNTTLSQLAFVRDRPTEGEIWENNIPTITVRQTVDGGVLAETELSSLTPELGTSVFFVRTPRRYADGDKLATGFYLCTGMYSYITIKGANKTVHAFTELPQSMQKELYTLAAKKRQELRDLENRQKQIAEEERKHPTTVDSWVRSAFRGVGIGDWGGGFDFSGAFNHLRNKSYVFGLFRVHYENDLKKRTANAKDKREYQRIIVQTFANWVFQTKINANMAFLDKFMPTLRFDSHDKMLVLQKSLRDKVEIRWDRKDITKLSELQKKHDWLGLLNLGFDNGHQLKEIKDDVAYWLLYDELMRKLISRPNKVYVYAEGDAKTKFVSDSLDVTEFRIRRDARSSGVGVWKGEISFISEARIYVREDSMQNDRAMNKLSEDFMQRKNKIVSEYRHPIDPEDEKSMRKRIEDLRVEFKTAYEKWLEEN